MKKYTILLIPLLFLMTYCNKEAVTPTTIVEGTVVEFGTKKPVPNVLMLLNKSSGFSGSWSTSWTTIDTFRTDATGHYHYSFSHEAGGNYELVLRLPPFYAGYVYSDVVNGRVTKKEFVLDPPCWLRLSLKNISPINNNDEISFLGSNIGSYTYYGMNVDSTKLYSNYGNRYIQLRWSVLKNNIRMDYKDSLFCTSHDTCFYQIKY